MVRKIFAASILALALQFSGASLAEAACTLIKNPADLNKLRNNLRGEFCLARTIDMGAVANFVPIGTLGKPFTGSLDGRGFAILNLTVKPKTGSLAGLFGAIARGSVKNLRIERADVVGSNARSSRVGTLAGLAKLSTIANVHVSGTVRQNGAASRIGGLVGLLEGVAINGSSAAVQAACDEDSTVGGLVGSSAAWQSADGKESERSSIANSSATGNVACSASGPVEGLGAAGGLAGYSGGDILRSSATGAVTCRSGARACGAGSAGGLTASNDGSGSIVDSFATGAVKGWLDSGGLVDVNYGTVQRSFATGTVEASASAAGLVADNWGAIFQSYAGGSVRSTLFDPNFLVSNGYAAGLVAEFRLETRVEESFAFGRVSGAKGVTMGGLVARNEGSSGILSSYWDKQTTRRANSDGGTPRSTSQLQDRLPSGFVRTAWAITPDATYPYHRTAALAFHGTLATTVLGLETFTFLPIGQRDPTQYSAAVPCKDLASKAAAFTMLARAIGTTRNLAGLQNAKINQYFNNSSGQAVFSGPVIRHATLGPLKGIPAATPLGSKNILGPLRNDKLVILRGTYRSGGVSKTHWLLATSFVVDGTGKITAVVADDSWTGKQVRVDASTKRVTSPAGFPLAGFKVNGFQVVTLNAP